VPTWPGCGAGERGFAGTSREPSESEGMPTCSLEGPHRVAHVRRDLLTWSPVAGLVVGRLPLCSPIGGAAALSAPVNPAKVNCSLLLSKIPILKSEEEERGSCHN
jgi:hypothetical protein